MPCSGWDIQVEVRAVDLNRGGVPVVALPSLRTPLSTAHSHSPEVAAVGAAEVERITLHKTHRLTLLITEV